MQQYIIFIIKINLLKSKKTLILNKNLKHEKENYLMEFCKATLLFFITAIAEIVGCYLPYLWLKENKSILLLIPAILSLSLFVWLLTLHPAASGRVYAAYGGIYIIVALFWLWKIDGIQPTLADTIGAIIVLIGTLIIICGSKT